MNETNTEKNSQIGMCNVPVRDAGEREAGKGFEHVKEVAANVAQGVSSAASFVHQKAQDVLPDGGIREGMEHARGTVKDVVHNVSDAASYVRHKADTVTTAVGGAMEDTGHYLRDDGISRIATDLTNIIRRNPIPSMLAGMAVGFLLSQATHRRGESYPRNGDIHG